MKRAKELADKNMFIKKQRPEFNPILKEYPYEYMDFVEQKKERKRMMENKVVVLNLSSQEGSEKESVSPSSKK